ncbi:MAG TPA: hypothetical protein VIW24_00105, partial [Aldersonia sp.]
QRLVQYLAFVASATAFLAGSGLTATQGGGRGVGFFIVAGAATLLILAVIALTVSVLAPNASRVARAASAYSIVEGHIEVDIPTNEGHLLRNLALLNDQSVAENAQVLKKLRSRYVSAIALGALQLALLVALVWFWA